MEMAQAWLESARHAGSLRSLTQAGATADFSSNDYLGLSQSPEIRAALVGALESGIALGSSGSRLLRGNTPFHSSTERELAAIMGFESALLFGSAYGANLGVLGAVGDQETCFFSDEFNHASLIDGMRLTHARRRVFQHNDLDDLDRALAGDRSRRKVIVVESVYSMGGDLAPLAEVAGLAARHGAWLVVDEAHATGLMGEDGLGLARGLDRSQVPLVIVHAAGKALGAQGGFVLSSECVRQLIVNRARTFVYSTAPTPLLCVHILASLKWAVSHPELRARCLDNASVFRERFPSASRSPIIPVIVPGNGPACGLAAFVRARGFDVRAIRSPTVPFGSERLRVTIQSGHTAVQIRAVADAIDEGRAHA